MEELTIDQRKELLRAYFEMNGMLLCNESKDLPCLESVGGDWNSIIALIEEGQVFYSKLYRGRVTYLSKEFYANIKPYRQRLERLSPEARLIYNFLTEIEMANTAQIKQILCLSNKTFTQSMDELFKELLVTAIERDMTINANWSSFYWGTYEKWENLHSIADVTPSMTMLKELTKGVLSEKKLASLLK